MLVFDVAGRRVRRLFGGRPGDGAVQLVWDGRADDARRVPAGIYFARVLSPDGQALASRKLVLAR